MRISPGSAPSRRIPILRYRTCTNSNASSLRAMGRALTTRPHLSASRWSLSRSGTALSKPSDVAACAQLIVNTANIRRASVDVFGHLGALTSSAFAKRRSMIPICIRLNGSDSMMRFSRRFTRQHLHVWRRVRTKARQHRALRWRRCCA